MKVREMILKIVDEDGFCTGDESDLIEMFSVREIIDTMYNLIDENILIKRDCEGFAVERIEKLKEMTKININFGNLIQELKDKNLKMFVRKTKGGVIYIENNIGEIYGAGLVCINGVYHCLYLDELLEKKLTVEFEKVEDTSGLWKWDREYWDVDYLNNFIKTQERINSREWIIEAYNRVNKSH
ncbi:hypothetical protein G6Z34_13410 [Clostridium perfringens]|uniref:Uncharacterized protein n=1 Tax=Clostridium perfringens TaxID=1502 RepID=A0AAP6WNI0_CLOPF|nr:hypothetical protein [Clostridium perfringens]NGU31083.1 hypothetical protein [Clostridium perfringens]